MFQKVKQHTIASAYLCLATIIKKNKKKKQQREID